MNEFYNLIKLLNQIQVTDKNSKTIVFDKSCDMIIRALLKVKTKTNKVIFVGNGGSSSIANHMATDFLKNGNLPALAFGDSSLLTCISNDLGYENVFSKPIDVLSKKGDLVFAISSSGKSQNILKAVLAARKKGCFVVTLSGFSPKNPLRKLGDINFYAPSLSYGDVEIAHLAVCHFLADEFIGKHS